MTSLGGNFGNFANKKGCQWSAIEDIGLSNRLIWDLLME